MNKIFHLLIPLAAYFVMGKFGLLLSIPPGFASAVWPASGIALACLLLLNPTLATLGVGLGSFLTNHLIVIDGHIGFSDSSAIVPAGIAIGAMLQAQAAYYLFRLCNDSSPSLNSPKDIYRFTLIVAPLSCILSASAGVMALYFNGIISIENSIFNWATWWVGDTIGVLLFAPLMLHIFANKNLSRERKTHIILPTLVIFIGILLLFMNSVDARKNHLQNVINDDAKRFYQLIEEHLVISKNKLYAYAAFHQGSSDVSMQEFYAFSKTLLATDNVFNGVGWTEIVPDTERARYEQEIKNQGHPNYSFKEFSDEGKLIIAKQREFYYPVLYIYPSKENVKAFGLDLAVNKERLAALTKAKKLFTPIATAPVELAQETAGQMAIIIYMPIFDTPPVYAYGRMMKNPEQFKGFVSGVLKVSGLFGSVLSEANYLHYDFSISDVTNPEQAVKLLTAKKTPLSQFSPAELPLTFANRKYQISFFATEDYKFSSKDWLSWSILTLGLLLTALLQAFILIITGITDNIRNEVNRKTDDLLKAKQAAELANSAKSQFLANMNHELRTPLNAITGFISLCLKTSLSEKQLSYLQKAQLASETLMSLINQTLDYSKIEAGKLEIEISKFSLINLLLKIHAIFSLQAAEKNIVFHVILPESLPRIFLGDSLRLEQVLLNLCSNAFKFTQQGSIDIIINIIEKSSDTVNFEISISDTGIGIAAEQQPQLFESFNQADSSTTRNYGGSGLGLAISKQLLELMGGHIELSSTLGQGSRFSIFLKLKFIPEEGEKNREQLLPLFPSTFTWDKDTDTIANASPLTDNSRNSEKSDELIIHYTPLSDVSILLVEDVKMNQMVASCMLEDLGAEVTVADNGLAAVELLEKNKLFDLILMDVQMPIMDGYDATTKIRNDDTLKHIPIVAMTSNVTSDDIHKCIQAGMNDHISKPVDEAEMLVKVLKNIHRS